MITAGNEATKNKTGADRWLSAPYFHDVARRTPSYHSKQKEGIGLIV